MNGPRYRAEHVGSLLRPLSLTAAFRAWSAGEIGDDIQRDDVPLVLLCDPDIRARLTSHGEDADALADLYVGAINDARDGTDARSQRAEIGRALPCTACE